MAGLLGIIQKILKRLSHAQVKYLSVMILIIIGFSIFCGVGATKIFLESDLSKFDPQELPVVKLRKKIGIEFKEFASVVVLIELDDSVESNIVDIRDPKVIEFLVELDGKLRKEPTIQEVRSVGLVFSQTGVPDSLEGVKAVLNQVPETSGAFDGGYEWTMIFIEADVGADDAKIKALNSRINEILETSTVPGGVRVTTTGDAPLGSAIFTLLIRDAFFTLIFSSVVIFLLVALLQRSIRKGIVIMFPLMLGILWTVGTMGWLGIPITIATAAMGAMLLGLGVEYSIFLVSRYKEERQTKSKEKSLEEAVVNIGSTLVSSGTTTLIGFLALSLSIFPMLSDLGQTLAIGIAYMFSATIFAGPVVLLIEEKIEGKLKGEKEIRRELSVEKEAAKRLKITNVYNAYGKFLSQKPLVVLMIAVGVTFLMIWGTQQIVDQDVEFETILPEDLEAMIAYIKINDEFGDDSSALIYVEVSPEHLGSDEPRDIRDPRVLNYVDKLAGKAMEIEDVLSVSSIAKIVKNANGGFIPNTIASEREIFETPDAQHFVNDGLSATLVRISMSGDLDSREVVRQIKKIIEETEKPAGVNVLPSGGLVVEQEMNDLNGPDSQRTSLYALIGIVVFLYALTRKVKSTVLPLFTVVLGIIWTLGLTGFFKVPFNNITSSVITMTIGIGIDFGLQVMNRYNQELTRHEKRKAMEVTMTNILTPMIITLIAAMIGFRAMGLGELKIMGDLGILMSFGVAASMFAAITAVAAIIVLFQRKNVYREVGKKTVKKKRRRKR